MIFFPSCNCRLQSGSFSRAFAALMICLFMLVIFSFVRDLLACFHIKDFYFSSSSKVASTNEFISQKSVQKKVLPKPNQFREKRHIKQMTSFSFCGSFSNRPQASQQHKRTENEGVNLEFALEGAYYTPGPSLSLLLSFWDSLEHLRSFCTPQIVEQTVIQPDFQIGNDCEARSTEKSRH